MKPTIPKKLPFEGIAWDSLIPKIGEANRAVARYDGVLYGVPNPGVLLSPLTTQEAVLSSRIEGTRTTLDEVLKFEAGVVEKKGEKFEDIQEVLNYRRALREAERELVHKPFNLNLLLKLHGILLDSVRGRYKGRGKFRTVQNYIGLPGAGIEAAVYVPPEPGLVLEYMDNWEKYYHAVERDRLVQLAILHAQFEIIHPFVDGNGRIGRMLVPLFLNEMGLLSRPTFYISAYLEIRREQYFSLLRILDGPESWNRWIRFFLDAITEQARENTEKALGILALYDRFKVQVLDLTRSKYAIPLLDHLFRQPIVSPSQLFKEKDLPSKPTVMSLLGIMREAGILKTLREASGRRPQILALADLINLCEGRRVL
jgi:Fic family protein